MRDTEGHEPVTSMTKDAQRQTTAVDDGLFDPFAPGFREDPYSFYRHWRRLAPVHWGAAPEPGAPGCWYVLGYDEVRSVLHGQDTVVEIGQVVDPSLLPPIPAEHLPFFEMIGSWFIFRDPPAHDRLRAAVKGAFTPAAVQRMEGRVETICGELVDGLDAGGCDLMTDLAFPLPVRVIGELLGVPEEAHPELKGWSAAVLEGIDLKSSGGEGEVMARATEAVVGLRALLTDLLEARRKRPAEDLLTTLAQGQDRGELSELEAVATCTLLLWAGHETTVNLIGNGVLALLENARQMELLQERPGLMSSAIEEMLRFDGPAQMTFRFAARDFELGGRLVRAGEPLALVLGAANRDPGAFDHPDRFDVERSPNPHVGFGGGTHFCLGVWLARLEARVAFERILRRKPRLARPKETLRWKPSIGLRGLAGLPVLLDGDAGVDPVVDAPRG